MSNTEITQAKPTDLKGWLNHDTLKSQIAAALPKHMTAERFCRIAITALSRTPKLQECTQQSFFKCLLDLSAMGLEPDGRRAHLIPFENRKAGTVECTLIVDYKGMIDLVRRDPNVVDVQAYTVRENDSIVIRNGVPDHTFNPIHDRGNVMAVYSKIVWANGTTTYGEPMTRKEMESVRNRSKSWDAFLKYKKEGPWNTDENEMWKKTVIRRDSKMWPLSPEIREAVEKDDDQYTHGMRNVTPQAPPSFALPTVNESLTVDEPQPAKELTPEEAWGEEGK